MSRMAKSTMCMRAIYCKCSYVGTEETYQRYQKLALEKEIAHEKLEAAEINEGANMNWRMWTAWGAYY